MQLTINRLQETINALENKPAQMKRYLLLGVRSALNDIADYARANHRFTSRSNNLERSVTVDTPVDNNGIVNGTAYLDEGVAFYGPFQHDGTGLYGPSAGYIQIFPRNRAFLRWPNQAADGFIFAKKVLKNPGVKPDPFLYKAAERPAAVNAIFNRYVEMGIKG